MALGFPAPKNGAVVLPSTGNSDFASYEYAENQQTESVIAYGAAVYDPYRGSGTPHSTISANGYAKTGAANTNPGFGATTGGMTTAAGATATLTVDTNTTITGAFVVGNIRLSHARIRPIVGLSYNLDCAGDPTITWVSA
jgi:hypothetical protein